MSSHLAVIPVFNEVTTIADVVARVACHGPVLVVDDGSSDGSAASAAAAGAAVLCLARRRGKGGALRAGFAEALSRGAERVLTLDGDGQHDPDDIPKLLAASAALPGTLVIGSRLVNGGAASMEPVRLKAMRIAGFFINWLVGRAVADTQSGFRVYPRRLLETVKPRRGGFTLESEMLLRAAAAGFAIREVPVRLVLEAGRPSHFRPFQDGTAVATYLIWCGILRWVRNAGIVAAVLLRPFTPARIKVRHREMHRFAAPYRYNYGAYAMAMGAFILDRIAESWRGWWRDPRARVMRRAALATACLPVLAVAGTVQGALRLRRLSGVDIVSPLVRRVFSQELLAPSLPSAAWPESAPVDYDVSNGGPEMAPVLPQR